MNEPIVKAWGVAWAQPSSKKAEIAFPLFQFFRSKKEAEGHLIERYGSLSVFKAVRVEIRRVAK